MLYHDFLFAIFPTSQGNTDLHFQHGPLFMPVPLIILMRNGTCARTHARTRAHTHTTPLSIIPVICTCLIYLHIYLINLLI